MALQKTLSVMMSCLCLCVFLPSVFADNEKPTFGIIDWFPFGWVEAGENRGMVVDIAKAIDEAIAVSSEKVVSPVPRVLRAMENAEFDFTITYRDPTMLDTVDYLADLGCLRSAVVSFRSAPVSRLEQLNGLRVAYPGGGYFVKRFLPHLRLEGTEVAQTDIMFRMAYRNRLDAFIINDAVWFGYKNDLHPDYKVPKSLWPRFAEPAYVETLPLAVSIAKGSRYQHIGNKMKGLMQNRAFVEALLNVYKKYQLPNALACLSLTAPSIP